MWVHGYQFSVKLHKAQTMDSPQTADLVMSAGSLIFTDQIMTAACRSQQATQEDSATVPDHEETNPGHNEEDSQSDKTQQKNS